MSVEGQHIYKLAQKIRGDQSDPSEVLITNIYLTEDEYARLATLPGCDIVKTRVAATTSTHTFAVDTFHGRLQGLRLAEVEVEDLGDALELPTWLGDEVTHDDRFSGGHLAVLSAGQLRDLLRTR